MKNMINPVIVVVAYNREKCISRLLDALANAKYDDEVTLIISIDHGDNQNVIDIADNYVWSHGKKIVRTFTENLGCREHVMKCIDYSIEYGAAIIFEDDILPAMNFYTYVKKSLQFYSDNESIFAIALHNQLWNGFADALYVPVRNEFDVYIAQIECSRGECFIGDKWKAFKEWYYQSERKLEVNDNVPRAVQNWNDSWCKYVLNYIVENNLYYVTPYDSLTTCFTDAGVHLQGGEIKYKYQVPLAHGKEVYMFPDFESAVKYDAFFESIDLRQHIEKKYGKKVAVDYYGTRDSYGNAQLCFTRKVLPYEILEMYGDDMIQPELNYIYNIQGEDIILYDLEKPAKEVERVENRNLIYFGNELKTAREIAKKHLSNMKVFDKWMLSIQQGKSIAEYLKKRDINSIAIYGIGMLGERLFDELYDSDIKVVCGIDKNLHKQYKNLSIKSINDIPDNVECIIVSAVFYYSEIKEKLSQNTKANVVSLQEILEELSSGN